MATRGRPKGSGAIYTPELGEQVCDLIASGRSMRQAAQSIGVDEKTIRNWKRDHEDFRPQYAHAEESRGEYYFERIIEIAEAITSGEEAQIARVQIDAIKWATSKLAPRKFGEKLQHTNPEGDGPVQVVVRHIGTKGE